MTYALAKIGNRWKPLILFRLLAGDLRFGELRHQITTITERMLALNLRELERDNLIIRKDFDVFPKKVSYSLTPAGRELNAVLAHICEWGAMDMLRDAAQKKQLLQVGPII
ncbi:helix-turn-helix domain-containing protein [Hymenobacter sp.]|uniref:winged helix-turn-helix transcriptional regulator n=1 Tax=Hymenobacter sp. TaxID=1898978 RepID=UPI00286BE622|nr:helix-turn-helix domain-containing protein [Hymenobacter sp.]